MALHTVRHSDITDMSDQKKEVTSSSLFPKDWQLAQQEKFALSPWDRRRLQATEVPRRKE